MADANGLRSPVVDHVSEHVLQDLPETMAVGPKPELLVDLQGRLGAVDGSPLLIRELRDGNMLEVRHRRTPP